MHSLLRTIIPFMLLSIASTHLLPAQTFHSDPMIADLLIERPFGYDTLDFSRLEFIYEQTDVDTVLSRAETITFMLSVGRDYTLYADYMDFKRDSICNALNWQVTNAMHDSIFSLYSSGQVSETLHDMRTGLFKVNEYNLFDFYLYEDSTARFDWTLLPDTATVCGIPCQKAEATFRGIHWTAWYAPSVPISIGPWKFNGLPGLILWAYDDKGTHDIKLVAARQGSGAPIAFISSGRIRMKRERVLRELEKGKTAPSSYKSLSGMGFIVTDENGNPEPLPVKRRFFAPYELE